MTAIILDADIPATLASGIRWAFGRGAAKLAAPYADASHRTVSDWLQGRSQMGAWHLLHMIRHPGFRAFIVAYCEHIDRQEAELRAELDGLAAKRAADLARVVPGINDLGRQASGPARQRASGPGARVAALRVRR